MVKVLSITSTFTATLLFIVVAACTGFSNAAEEVVEQQQQEGINRSPLRRRKLNDVNDNGARALKENDEEVHDDFSGNIAYYYADARVDINNDDDAYYRADTDDRRLDNPDEGEDEIDFDDDDAYDDYFFDDLVIPVTTQYYSTIDEDASKDLDY